MHIDPALYRILTVGLTHDIPHYQSLSQQFGSPILELGSGLGRITLSLVEDHNKVFALDHSPAMCSELDHAKQHLPPHQQENLNVICQDMCSFQLDIQCGLILIPLRTIQLLHTPEERFSCFSRAYEHLHKGGALAVHLGIFEKDKADSVWRGTWEGPCTDGFIEVDELLRYNPIQKQYQLRHRIRQYDLTGQQLGFWRVAHDLSVISEGDIFHELAEAGFSDLSSKPLLGRDKIYIATK